MLLLLMQNLGFAWGEAVVASASRFIDLQARNAPTIDLSAKNDPNIDLNAQA